MLTPAERSLDGCLSLKNLRSSTKDVFVPNQFVNPENPEAHYLTTGPEIWKQAGGQVDVFVAGVGSGGTLMGIGRYLKEKNPKLLLVAVEPRNNTALLGREPGLHVIQGIGDGFVPPVVDKNLIDTVMTVTTRMQSKLLGILPKTVAFGWNLLWSPTFGAPPTLQMVNAAWSQFFLIG